MREEMASTMTEPIVAMSSDENGETVSLTLVILVVKIAMLLTW